MNINKYAVFLVIYAVYVISMLFYWGIAIASPDTLLHYFTSEFGVPEVASAIAWLAASILALSVLQYRKRMNRMAIGFFALLAFFFFVCAGEEMSWGQHLIGFETPEQVAAINEQNEFNLHNLELEHIHPKDIVSWFMKIYGIILPIVLIKPLLRQGSSLRRYLPHPALVPCFVFPELIYLLQEPFDLALASRLGREIYVNLGSQAEEMGELYWALAAFFAMLLIQRYWTKTIQPE